MTRCKNIRKFLFEYNRSELDPERCRDVQVHLDNCPRCSACFSEAGTFLSSITYCKDMSEEYWAKYATKLLEKLENARRRTIFQLYLPELRPVITEALAGFLVVLGLFTLIEKGFVGYGLKTYIYLLKQAW